MTDDVFERRTRRFIETLEILERLRHTPWERFSTDPEKYGSAERFLQVAVEVLDDLGAHLVACAAARRHDHPLLTRGARARPDEGSATANRPQGRHLAR